MAKQKKTVEILEDICEVCGKGFDEKSVKTCVYSGGIEIQNKIGYFFYSLYNPEVEYTFHGSCLRKFFKEKLCKK